MPEWLSTGLPLVLLAGALQGCILLLPKWMPTWKWENYWLIFATSGYLVCPWALAAMTITDLLQVYRAASVASLCWMMLYGVGWAIGALTFGLGVDAVGLALGYPVILGVTATGGTLIPLLASVPRTFSLAQGITTGFALLLMLSGVVVCSIAGRWKEKTTAGSSSYRAGIMLCIASGVLSTCGNLGFAFGGEITRRAQSLGNPEHLAPNALWNLLALPLFLCNAGYAVHLLRRNGTAGRFHSHDWGRGWLLAAAMGVMWMGGMALYGIGARKLGPLGPSLGWAIFVSAMVLAANASGLLTGEWKMAPRGARRQFGFGIATLMLAIAALGFANHLGRG